MHTIKLDKRTMSNDTHVTDVCRLVHELTDLIYREVTGGIAEDDDQSARNLVQLGEVIATTYTMVSRFF